MAWNSCTAATSRLPWPHTITPILLMLRPRLSWLDPRAALTPLAAAEQAPDDDEPLGNGSTQHGRPAAGHRDRRGDRRSALALRPRGASCCPGRPAGGRARPVVERRRWPATASCRRRGDDRR